MASTPKQNQVNGSATVNNGLLGKRKKSRRSRSSYLSKWLDKTMNQIQDSTPSMDTYDSFVNPYLNWTIGNSQFTPGHDYRYNLYGSTPEPMSLPTLPSYYSPAMPPMYPEYRYIQNQNKSIPVQRPKLRPQHEYKAEEVDSTQNDTPNSTLSNPSYNQPKNISDSQEFASLPPIITSVGDTTSMKSNSDVNGNEKDDGIHTRRYSDPYVQGLPDVARPANGDADSESESSSGLSGSHVGSRLLTCLLDQITSLKMANERLSKDLQDTRADLNNIRQHNNIWQKGSSPGLTPAHTPFNNGLVGNQYSPGFLTDLVREIREAARMREEALYSRVRAMVVEKADNGVATTEAKLNEKSLEEIKSTLRIAEAEKLRMLDRIVKLEDELRIMRLSKGGFSNEIGYTNGNFEDPESERQRLRKELADMRKEKQSADDRALKLERLVTQLRSKFNGLQISPNGPDSLPSDHEPDTNSRTRRTSVNSNNNTNPTVVFGPVTDL